MIATSAYDGVGRRITKVVTHSGDLDMTYHFYYEGQSIIEIRNGSDLVLKQHVWATLANGYIDELLQTTANRDLFNNPSMDIPYPWGGGPWADPLKAAMYDSLHDANYNIQGLIEDATEGGNLVERYEYTPYGQRLVLRSSGGNDPLCHTPTFVSQRQAMYAWTLGTPEELVAFPQPFGLNEFGHQGLYHDEETAPGGGAGATLIYNRARMLHTRLGRFTQRDPLGYVDGMSGYAAYAQMQMGTDPSGMDFIAIAGRNIAFGYGHYSIEYWKATCPGPQDWITVEEWMNKNPSHKRSAAVELLNITDYKIRHTKVLTNKIGKKFTITSTISATTSDSWLSWIGGGFDGVSVVFVWGGNYGRTSAGHDGDRYIRGVLDSKQSDFDSDRDVERSWNQVVSRASFYEWSNYAGSSGIPPKIAYNWPKSKYSSFGTNSNVFVRQMASRSGLIMMEHGGRSYPPSPGFVPQQNPVPADWVGLPWR